MSTLASPSLQQRLENLRANLRAVILGKEHTIELLTVSFLAGGSVLMEDVPGVGKTTLAKALAQSLQARFHRVQFTPDLLPADILGTSIYNPQDGSFSFREGPVFCHILLADEINRASPRTQSALLEAMSEGQATVEGVLRRLPQPFIVLATQNPVEFHGTYPLPEAQLDRFMMRLDLGYPDRDAEVTMLYAQQSVKPVDRVEPVIELDDILAMQEAVRAVHVDPAVAQYTVALAVATRHDERLKIGVSPRGSIMLFRAAQAAAFGAGRDYVLPDDVQAMAGHVLPHRLILTSKARYGGTTPASIVEEIISQTAAPS